MTNTALAKFITSLGTFNDYGSTEWQTKLALDQQSTQPLRQNPDDLAIFSDTVKAITAIQQLGFTPDGIIAINQQFDSPSAEQPTFPGHLRNSHVNPDDRIAITIDTTAKQAYFPPEVVTKADLAAIVSRFVQSQHLEEDAWRVFVSLAKLQPFQDGNKRTALIAANAANGSLISGDYLVLPFNDLDRIDFMTALMRFYAAKDATEEDRTFARLLETLPTPSDRQAHLRKVIQPDEADRFKTVRVKHEIHERQSRN